GRWHDMTSSQLLRVRFLDVRAHEIAGRVAAACARGPDDPAISECVRMARWLERQAQTWPRSLALLLRALVARRRGDDERAAALLEGAEAAATESGSALHAASLRRQRGVLAGGAGGQALIDGADEALRAMGVAAPERYAWMLVPI